MDLVGALLKQILKNFLVLLGRSKLTHRTDVGCGRFADIRAGASEKWLPCIFWWGGFMVSWFLARLGSRGVAAMTLGHTILGQSR